MAERMLVPDLLSGHFACGGALTLLNKDTRLGFVLNTSPKGTFPSFVPENS